MRAPVHTYLASTFQTEVTLVKLTHYAAAGYPVVAVSTADEDRAIAGIVAAFPERQVLRIAAIGGLLDAKTGMPVDERAQYPAAFGRAASRPDQVLIVLDYQHQMVPCNAPPYRLLRDSLPRVKAQGSLIILIAPSWQMPPELGHDIPVLDEPLPSRDELKAALDLCTQNTQTTLNNALERRILDHASGLTLAEAENAFALSYTVNNGVYDADTVANEKIKLVKQTGLVEILPSADPSELGGLQILRQCIDGEIIPSMEDAELAVSSILMDGVPGTGKSLSARVLAGKLGYPILKVSVSRLKASHVGESERNINSVFKLARAIAPVVMFFDELEKGVGGFASSAQSDSGVTLGMVETILTQMQEIRDAGERVFFIATTNDYAKLPAELTRRFEIKFFVDLPSAAERSDIAAKKLAKYAPSAAMLAAQVAELTDEWTGAEIEDLVRSAARRTQRKITVDALKAAAEDIKPIAKVRADEIARLRDWGRANLRLANSTGNGTPTSTRTIRKSIPTIDPVIAETFSGGKA